jgi:hypothetical protein
LVAFSGALTLPVGGAVLALSAIPELRRPTAVRPVLVLQAVLVIAIVGLGVIGILEPSFVPAVPEAASTAAWIVLGFGLVFYSALAVRAARTYLLTRRMADLVVVYGLVLLAVALVPGLLMEYYELGWWLGHGWELIGIGLVGVPVALDLHRGAQSRALVGDLRASELVSAADAFVGPTVRALLVRLAHKDDYTAEHTRGVALRAVQAPCVEALERVIAREQHDGSRRGRCLNRRPTPPPARARSPWRPCGSPCPCSQDRPDAARTR